MSVQEPSLTVSKSPAIDEKIKSIYVNYLQLVLDAARDPKLKEELFASNKKRIEVLNDKVGMTMPPNVHVIFDTKNFSSVKVYVKSKEGKFFIEEGAKTLKIVEKLATGQTDTETMTLATTEEVDLNVHESFKDSDVVLRLPFVDPTSDLLLFELKYDDSEIIFSTCIAASPAP